MYALTAQDVEGAQYLSGIVKREGNALPRHLRPGTEGQRKELKKRPGHANSVWSSQTQSHFFCRDTFGL
jgi:hypothetical protein